MYIFLAVQVTNEVLVSSTAVKRLAIIVCRPKVVCALFVPAYKVGT